MTPEAHMKSDLGIRGPIPADVLRCVERLDGRGVWWKASRNHDDTEVFSCRQAAQYRDRLGSGGNGGIPIWAELKSLVGAVTDPSSGSTCIFAAHTRANTRFIERLLANALGYDGEAVQLRTLLEDDATGPTSRGRGITSGELRTLNDRWFGRVNPFNVDQVLADLTSDGPTFEDIRQIFDESLLLDGGTPDTVMTNLGSRTLAFEIRPGDLISVVKSMSPRSIVAPIAEPSPIWLGLSGTHRKDYFLHFPPPRGPRIGILTGNGPESGRTLWQDLLDVLHGLYSYVPDVLMPDVRIHSLPEMGLSMELAEREREVREVVLRGAAGLLDAGCRLITVACNTTIYYEREIARMCDAREARFISIAEACMPAVRTAVQRHPENASVGLVGIGPVVDIAAEWSGYTRHLQAEGVPIVSCSADRLAFAVKSKGTADHLVTEFRRLIKSLPEETKTVILALTEASIVYRRHVAQTPRNRAAGRRFIDPLLELAKYLAFLYLRQGYTESEVCKINDESRVVEKLQAKLGWGPYVMEKSV